MDQFIEAKFITLSSSRVERRAADHILYMMLQTGIDVIPISYFEYLLFFDTSRA
jgi:hypothetical protein